MNNKLLLTLLSALALTSCGNQTVTCPEGQVLVGSKCTVQTGQLVIVNPKGYRVEVTPEGEKEVIPESRWGALTPGPYLIKFSLEGYVSEIRYAEVKAGQAVTLSAPNLVARTTGELHITNPRGYAVTVKSSLGQVVSPDNYGAMLPGRYDITFSGAGLISETFGFNITAGKSTPIVAPTLLPSKS